MLTLKWFGAMAALLALLVACAPAAPNGVVGGTGGSSAGSEQAAGAESLADLDSGGGSEVRSSPALLAEEPPAAQPADAAGDNREGDGGEPQPVVEAEPGSTPPPWEDCIPSLRPEDVPCYAP